MDIITTDSHKWKAGTVTSAEQIRIVRLTLVNVIPKDTELESERTKP